MSRKLFFDILAQLNQAIKSRQAFAYVVVKQDALEILRFLLTRGFITDYSITNESAITNKLVIADNTNQTLYILVHFKIVDNQNFVSGYMALPQGMPGNLAKLAPLKNRGQFVLVLRTTWGLLTFEEANCIGVGGTPAFIIIL